ncbi:MAG: hypothetical protein GX572_04245 [Clostridia bacterium]|nr:hypothetical protein [Clostridia bacterium]
MPRVLRADCHADTALWLLEQPSLVELSGSHQDYRRISEYLDLAFLAIFLDEAEYEHELPRLFARLLLMLKADIAAHADLVEPLLWREQLEQSGADLPKLLLLGAEGASCLGADCQHLETYFQAGLRFIGLTWNYANAYAGGCGGAGGLTEAGRRLVDLCNAKGLLLDGAHLNEASFWDLAELRQYPFIVSHTCCAALQPHRRNLDDSQMLALAELDGVMGITFVPDFLGAAGDLRRLCEHIEYAVALIGSCHVALGSDFDGCEPHAELSGVQTLPRVYTELCRRGMNAADVDNVMGNSVVRLLARVLPSRARLD